MYLLIINIITGCVFAWDKRLARKHATQRIPERNLLLYSILGGSIGGLFGMYIFNHKTRHLKFKLGLPLILLLQIGLLLFLLTH
jgi:uncharacterized membrane protein YsdA (DUF1294 family)